MPAHAAGKPLEIWFEDEARVGQQGTPGAVWNEVGSRPAVARDDRHDSAWLFGSVCPKRSIGAALVMPWVGSEAMSLHLDAVSKMVTPGAPAVLVCDGAGWHQTGGRLRVPDNITLLPLPSYSPQLNPIENVWAYLRGNDQPVGTAALVPADLDSRPDLTPWMAGVFVEPAFRGRGHATALIRRVEALAGEASVPVLWLYTAKAEALYAELGWESVGMEVDRGEPVVLMRRILSSAP